MKKLQIVIPCYNEASSIPSLLRDCEDVYKNSLGTISFILVDNGSSDGTLETYKNSRSIEDATEMISISPNLGYGGGILAGLKVTHENWIGWTHADLQTPLSDLIKAQSVIPDHPVLIKGTRKGRSLAENFFTLGMSIFESSLFQSALIDINAQPTVFHKSIMSNWIKPPSDFSLDLYTLVSCRKNRIQCLRFSVTFKRRMHGISHWNSGLSSRIKFIFRTFQYSIKLRREMYAYYSASNK